MTSWRTVSLRNIYLWCIVCQRRRVFSFLFNCHAPAFDKDELRDADSRLGEYVEALHGSRDILRRYFDQHGKDLLEEWEKEQKKPKIEADLIDDN